MFNYFKICCLSTILLTLVSTASKAQVNSVTTSINRYTEIQFIPPKDGEEPETKGAGTRNPEELKCSPNEQAIKAIMPQTNYGLTTQARPQIFVYLPPTNAQQVVLAFRDRERQYYEVAFLPISRNSSIVSFALPEDKPALEANKYYQWQLTLVCGHMPHVDDPILTGWVKRTKLDRQITEIQQKETMEQAHWYAQNGYWYDLLEQINLEQQQNTQNNFNSNIWQQLINQD